MDENFIWVILALIAVVIIGLFMIGARLMRMDGRTDSQARQFENISDQQARSREAQLKSLAEMQKVYIGMKPLMKKK